MSRYSNMTIDPDMRSAWEKALTGPVVVHLQTKKDATSLRHKLYQARKIMEAKADPLYTSVLNLSITISPHETGGHDLTIQPGMREVKAALRAAIGEPTQAPDFEDL